MSEKRWKKFNSKPSLVKVLVTPARGMSRRKSYTRKCQPPDRERGGGREEVREKGGKQERRKEIKERNAKGWERERRIT